jgi:hypothetical protein
MSKTIRNCGNCYNFNHEPYYDFGEEYPAGCGETYEAVASVDSLTGHALTYRERIATDPACPDYLTEQAGTARDAASYAKHEADQLRETSRSLKFDKAMAECLHLDDALGKNHPDTITATAHALSLAPQELHDLMMAKMRELNLVPKPIGYTADGQALYRLEDIAAKLGISNDEAQSKFQKLMGNSDEEDLPAMTIDPILIHRVH